MKLDGAGIITGFKENITLKDLKKLPIKEKIFIYKYIELLNKISLVKTYDKFYFIDDLVTGVMLIEDLTNNLFDGNFHKDILEEAKLAMKMLELKFKKYKNEGISTEERDQYKKEIKEYISKTEEDRKEKFKLEKNKMRKSKVVVLSDWIKLKESE